LPESFHKTLKALRSSEGEALVLDENMFIEKMLPGVTQRTLSVDEMEAGVVDAVSKAKPGTELKMIIEHYLSPELCANPSAGFPMAALSLEIALYPRSVRVEIHRVMRRRIKRLARSLPGKTWKERERNCLVLMSGMVGALNVARAAVDRSRATKEFYIKAFSGIFTQKVTLVQELR
jgi:hypothetical protein